MPSLLKQIQQRVGHPLVEGRQPVGLTSSYLLHHPLPDDWEKQRVLVKTL